MESQRTVNQAGAGMVAVGVGGAGGVVGSGVVPSGWSAIEAGHGGSGAVVVGGVLEHAGTGLTLGLSAGLGYWADYAGGQFNDALNAWHGGDVERAIELALYAASLYEAIGQGEDAVYAREWAGV
jgi:hypothetical protein